MKELKKVFGVLIVSLFFINEILCGATYYVSKTGHDSNIGSIDYPFATVQKGIDTAVTEDVVIVDEGIYYENISFKGKEKITVKSSNPDDPDIVDNTIIAGSDLYPVVCLAGISDPNTLLTGFTITSRDPNLIAHWKLDESSGIIAEDSAGDNDGTVFGSASWRPDGGQIDGAVMFDGTNNYIQAEGYKGITGTGSRTVAAWIKPDDPNSAIISWGQNAGVYGSYWYMLVNYTNYGEPNALHLSVFGGNLVGTTDLVTDGKWHHVAAVLEDDGSPDSSEIKLYVDGKLEVLSYSTSTSINTIEGSDVYIGSRFDDFDHCYGGLIDDVRIYNRAMKTSEIEMLASAYPDGFISQWTFDDGEPSPDITYDTTNNNHAYLFGDAADLIYNFNNRGDYIEGAKGLILDGDGDYASADGICNDIAGKDFTLTTWVKSDSISTQQFFAGFNTSLNGNRLLLGHKAGSYTLQIVDMNATPAWQDTGISIYDGLWHFVTLVFDDTNNTVYIYVDGDVENGFSFSTTTQIAFDDKFTIGAEYDDTIPQVGDFFDGCIDDMRFYDRLLTKAEITVLARSKYRGGIWGGLSNAAISNCVIRDNAADIGGGIYQCDGLIDECLISNNLAVYGGGIADCNGIIDNSVITKNTADSVGGGMYNVSIDNLTVTNCEFSENSAILIEGAKGGAVYNNNSSPEFDNCRFIKNFIPEVLGQGGAVCNINNSNPMFKDCYFALNFLDDYGGVGLGTYGGAMYNKSCTPILINCVLAWNHIRSTADNTLSGGGGGLANIDSNAKLINCVIVENISLYGGGIFNNSGSPELINCTLSRNEGFGGALCNLSASCPEITNCILWGNRSANSELNEISNQSDCIPVIKNSNIRGCKPGGVWDGTLGTDSGGNIEADPEFAAVYNPAGDDCVFGTPDDGLFPGIVNGSINPGNESINSGENSVVTETFDITGNTRIVNSTVDMGAYEVPLEWSGTGISVPVGKIWYVDADANTGGDGESWATAFEELQSALTNPELKAGDEIWVSDGTYKPGSVADPNNPAQEELQATFTLVNGVGIYGGFNGSEINKSARDWNTNLTVLSGDLLGNDVGTLIDESRDDNSIHVVTGTVLEPSTVLDGFTISDGHAELDIPRSIHYTDFDNGGGMYNHFGFHRIVNCTFIKNRAKSYGGAVVNVFSNPSFIDCAFNLNETYGGKTSTSNYGGGAMANLRCSPYVYRSIFENNECNNHIVPEEDSSGNAIYSIRGSAILDSCEFISNGVDRPNNELIYGGAAAIDKFSNILIKNSTFKYNIATWRGGAIYVYNNSILSYSGCSFIGNLPDDIYYE